MAWDEEQQDQWYLGLQSAFEIGYMRAIADIKNGELQQPAVAAEDWIEDHISDE